MYASTAPTPSARSVVEVPLGRGFRVSARRRARRRSTPRTRLLFLTSPNNPTGLIDPAAPTSLRIAERGAAGAGLRRRGLRRLRRRQRSIGDPDVAALPNLVVGRTFAKAYGLAGLRAGALIGASGHARAVSRASCRPSASMPAPAAALPRRARRREYYDWYLGQVRESKSAALRRARAAGSPRTGRAPRTSCSRASAIDAARDRRRRWRRAAFTSATGRAIRRRRLRPDHDRRGRAHHARAFARSRRSCAARRNRTADDRDVDHDAARRSTARAATTSRPASASSITCWSSSRGTAASISTLRAKGDLDVDQHHTVEDVGIALGEAVVGGARHRGAASIAPATS